VRLVGYLIEIIRGIRLNFHLCFSHKNFQALSCIMLMLAMTLSQVSVGSIPLAEKGICMAAGRGCIPLHDVRNYWQCTSVHITGSE
jgi:hypothetical protein